MHCLIIQDNSLQQLLDNVARIMTRFSSAQRRRNNMEQRGSRSIGSRRLLRIILRIVLYSVMAWLILALLWAFLPSPVAVRDREHAASILQAGKSLTRVYPFRKDWSMRHQRQNIALEYMIHNPSSTSASLEITGLAERIPFLRSDLSCDHVNEVQRVHEISVRWGSGNGANLPWFKFADAILLSWWVDREDDLDLKLSARWGLTQFFDTSYDASNATPQKCRRRLEIELENDVDWALEGLLSLDYDVGIGEDKIQIVKIGMEDGSDSPTWTYPIRVAIICVLAPASIFLHELAWPVLNSFGSVFIFIFGIFVWTFIRGAVVVSILRCCRGPSLEVTVERIQTRLDIWRESGRFSWIKVDIIQEKIDKFFGHRKVQAVLKICREGWHPEQESERLAREQAEKDDDMEKGSDGVRIKIRT